MYVECLKFYVFIINYLLVNLIILSSKYRRYKVNFNTPWKVQSESHDEGALNEVIPQSLDHSTEVHYNTMRVQ